MTLRLRAGQIVLAGWRDGLPSGPDKRRPAVIVEAKRLSPTHSTSIPVALTADAEVAPFGLAMSIAPTPENGRVKPCSALPRHVTAAPKLRPHPTSSRITAEPRAETRGRIAFAIGLA